MKDEIQQEFSTGPYNPIQPTSPPRGQAYRDCAVQLSNEWLNERWLVMAQAMMAHEEMINEQAIASKSGYGLVPAKDKIPDKSTDGPSNPSESLQCTSPHWKGALGCHRQHLINLDRDDQLQLMAMSSKSCDGHGAALGCASKSPETPEQSLSSTPLTNETPNNCSQPREGRELAWGFPETESVDAVTMPPPYEETSALLGATKSSTSIQTEPPENDELVLSVKDGFNLLFGCRTLLLFYGTWFLGLLRNRYYEFYVYRDSSFEFEVTPYTYLCACMFFIFISTGISEACRRANKWRFRGLSCLPHLLARVTEKMLRVTIKSVGVMFRIFVLMLCSVALNQCMCLEFFHLEASRVGALYLLDHDAPSWLLVADVLLFLADITCAIVTVLMIFVVIAGVFVGMLACYHDITMTLGDTLPNVNQDKAMEEGKIVMGQEKAEKYGNSKN